MKQCSGCKTELSVEQFGRNKRQPDGLQTECKLCKSRRYRNNKQTSPKPKNYLYRGTEWQDKANCYDVGAEIFHPTPGDHEAVKYAKSFCQDCPVQQECLDYISRIESNFTSVGIWGGLTPNERDELRRKNAI